MKSLFINTLKELSNNNINYALLRKPYNWVNTVDLDIIVEKSIKIDSKLNKLGYSKKCNSNTFIKYDFDYGKWIYIDINDPLKFGCYYADKSFFEELLKTKYLDQEGIYRISTTYEGILYLLHSAIDKGIISSKYRYLIYENHINKSFLIKYNDQVNLFQIYQYLLILRDNPKRERYVIRNIRKKFIKINLDFIFRKFVRLKNFLKGPRPIVFLGPDGSGKSTLVNILKDLRFPNIKLIYMGPLRESEMNKLLFKITSLIHIKREKYQKKSFLGIVIRVFWYSLCYLDLSLRVWSKNFYVSSGGVLICDRYACDIFFRQQNNLIKIIFLNFFLRPRFVFLCVGNPQKIFSRKPEIPINQIKDLIKNYRKTLKDYNIDYLELNTTENSIKIIIRDILNKLNDHKWFI
tara:strand:- start:2382 stop:3599 length:1218 start_codon:yes stop_codon:yes gene_type:complete